MDPINRDFSEPAERVRLMACRLIGNYPAKEYHHYLGSTPLHCAALEDHHEIVRLLLTSPRLNTANHVDDDGEAPIMKALLFQSTNAFRELVNHPSVDLSTTNKAGWSLEMVAR